MQRAEMFLIYSPSWDLDLWPHIYYHHIHSAQFHRQQRRDFTDN